MRWERLFGDLEAQLESGRRAEAMADLAEQTRAERSTVHLADRVRAAVGTPVRVVVADPETRPEGVVDGVLRDAAAEWFVLTDASGADVVVPVRAVRAVRGLGRSAAPPPGAVEARLGLGHALRALARDRVVVQVLTDAGTLRGRIDAVGADHLDLVDGRDGWVVPFAAIGYVRVTP